MLGQREINVVNSINILKTILKYVFILFLWLCWVLVVAHGIFFSYGMWDLVPRAVLCLVAQLCPTLCDPMDRSPPGSFIHGDSPGKNTESVAMLSLRGSSQPKDRTQVSLIEGRFFTI